jgi:LCP family protein required for cell wall assembly
MRYPTEPVTTSVPPQPHRSAFAAAFLTFLLPGLGHAYAGAYRRAVAFMALPVLILFGLLVQLARYGTVDFALWVGQTSVLGPLAVANVGILAYRVFATVDAYTTALGPDAAMLGDHGWRRFVPRLNPLSLAGLAAVLIVMAAGHVFAGYWDLRILRALEEIHTPIVVAAPEPTDTIEPYATSTAEIEATYTYTPQATIKPWDKKGRLNILLVGVDEQGGAFNTDTMIVASIDPSTHRVALFSMPRDTYGLEMPPRSALSAMFGSHFNYKLNTLWWRTDRYRTLFPNGGSDALKMALSWAFFKRTDAISYYVIVSFSGFVNVVDTLGGVTIDVPTPLIDNGFPGNGDGLHKRVYIPAGMQHLTGDEALTYARSRKASGYYNDYNRSARQEQILVALQQQVDLNVISNHLSAFVDALSGAVHTDIPEGPDVLGALIDQARYINLSNIKTYAFSTAGYGTQGSMEQPLGVFAPDLARIRATVAAVTGSGSLAPETVRNERAPIVVEVGSGTADQAADLVAYLQSLGLDAEISDTPGPAQPTTLKVVNGADTLYPETLALLEKTLGVSGPVSPDGSTYVQAETDPDQAPAFVIILGSNTPRITPPPV